MLHFSPLRIGLYASITDVKHGNVLFKFIKLSHLQVPKIGQISQNTFVGFIGKCEVGNLCVFKMSTFEINDGN